MSKEIDPQFFRELAEKILKMYVPEPCAKIDRCFKISKLF
jgi:hypothetical protein